MLKYVALTALPFLFLAAPSHAAESACQTTTGGNTVCSGDGALSCQTINGKTTCLTGKDGKSVEVKPRDENDDNDNDAAPPRAPRSRTVNKQVTVDQNGRHVHIENGNVSIEEK
jgi:hypothetical protein